jgi:hypothetical protein
MFSSASDRAAAAKSRTWNRFSSGSPEPQGTADQGRPTPSAQNGGAGDGVQSEEVIQDNPLFGTSGMIMGRAASSDAV